MSARSAVVLALVALTAAAFLRQFAQPAPAEWFAHDQRVYLAMARAPFSDDREARRAPASWRILPPLVARIGGQLSGGGPERGFFILTFASFALIPIATLMFLRAIGIGSTSSMLCAVLAALAPPVVGYMSWDIVRVDAFGLLLLCAAATAVVTERPILLVIAIVALGLTKETVLLVGFFAVAWSACFARTMLLPSLLAAASGIGLRWIVLPHVLPSPPVDAFGDLNGFRGMLDELSFTYVARRALLATAATFNLLMPVAVTALVRERRNLRTWVIAAAIVVAMAQMLFASDTQRIVAAAYPFVLALCARELDRLTPPRQSLIGSILIAGQVPWLLEYGRIAPELPGIRAAEISIVAASAIAATTIWRASSRE